MSDLYSSKKLELANCDSDRNRILLLAGILSLLVACGGGGSGGGAGGAQAFVATGVLDADFGTNGIRFFDFMLDSDRGNAIAIQSSGKILVAGQLANNGVTSVLAVVRFNGDGSLDTTFGLNGVASTGADGSAQGMALQTDGKIVVAGRLGLGGSDILVARINPDGALDLTFDGDGIALTDLGSSDRARAVAIQADGKIVVVGSTGGTPVNTDTVIVRYNADGSVDTGFGVNGVTKTNVSSGNFDGANSVVIQSDGKIVSAGTGGGPVSVLRYNNDGSLDTSFDTDGIVTTSVTGNSDSGNGVALQPDGKLLVCAQVGLGSDVGVIRYHPDGSLDSSFNGNGTVITNVLGLDGGNAVALQSNGQIVVAADAHSSAGLLRYNADGSLDAGFDADGIVTTRVAGFIGVSGLAIQADGRIVVVGSAMPSSGGPGGTGIDIMVLRYE